MRALAIFCALLSTGCSSLPPAELAGMSVEPRHPAATLERPWLLPGPKDEVTLFDSRTLQALRRLDESQALNQNANGRRVRHPGMWAGIGVGAAVGVVVVVVVDAVDEVADDVAEDFWSCFFDAFFGGDCEDDD